MSSDFRPVPGLLASLDLLQISHRADGQAVARQWLATSGAFTEGDAIELGAWRAATRYLTGARIHAIRDAGQHAVVDFVLAGAGQSLSPG